MTYPFSVILLTSSAVRAIPKSTRNADLRSVEMIMFAGFHISMNDSHRVGVLESRGDLAEPTFSLLHRRIGSISDYFPQITAIDEFKLDFHVLLTKLNVVNRRHVWV